MEFNVRTLTSCYSRSAGLLISIEELLLEENMSNFAKFPDGHLNILKDLTHRTYDSNNLIAHASSSFIGVKFNKALESSSAILQ